MKTLKRSFAVTIFSLLVTLAFAQPPGGQHQRMTPEERASQSTEWMTKELKLNNKEVKKVQEINLKYAKKQQKKMEEVR